MSKHRLPTEESEPFNPYGFESHLPEAGTREGDAIRGVVRGDEEHVVAKRVGDDIRHLLDLFDNDHLPEHLRTASDRCRTLAHLMVLRLEQGPELLVGLRHLLYAKDSFVRQAVADYKAATDG